MLQVNYLTEEHLKGFEKYKYSSIDTSPLSTYVMHPFWNQTVRLIPRWVAPNLLTFVGFVFVLLTAGLITYYDPDFSASSNSISSSQPIPNWVWLVCAVFHFTAHTLDGIDGKQARRTGTSGPLGELFDHGLDSWTSLFTPLCIYSIFGRADFSFPPIRVQFIFWSVFVTFYVSHWEKYVTGVLYLPWSYDMTQVTLLIMYLLSFSYGHYFWKFEYFGLSSGNIFELLTHVGSYAMSIPVTLYNVNLAIRSKTLKHKSWGERTRPLIPLFALFSITVGWSVYSPNDILDKHPRLFLFMTGTIFSNIACRLIVSQMSNTRCEVINWLLIPLALFVGSIFLIDGLLAKEVVILKIVTILAVIAHVHYGVCVVRQMADHFDIKVFSIKGKMELNNRNLHDGNDRQKLLNKNSSDQGDHH